MFTSPVILSAAYDEYIEVTIANNNTSSYDNLPIMIDINNSQLSDYGYILATGLDTNWATGASNAVYSLSNNKAFVFTSSILSNQQVVYNYQLGYSPAQTSYPVMTGYGGYLTIADAVSLELGNDFEIELSGYIDTSSGTSKLITDKGGAYICYPSNAGEVVALIGSATNISSATYYESTTSSVYGANWYGQTFIPISDIYVNSITLWCQKILAPSGNFNVYIYAVSGGVPTGTALATGSISASTISGTAGAQTFYLSQSAKLSSGTSYALAFSCPTGDASNYIKVWSINSDAYASGTKCSSSDSGVTWSAGSWDYYFIVGGYTPAVTLTATGIVSGDHAIKTVLSGGTFYLYVDNILEDSAAYAGSIIDNAFNWILMRNNSMPYLSYYKHTVGGVLKCWYQPNSIINPSALTDRSGNANSGVITYGANPAGINITLGGLASSTTYTTTGAGTDAPPTVISVPTTNMFEDTAATGDVLPAYGIFNRAAASLGLTTPTLYTIMFGFVAIVVFIAVAIATGAIVPGILAGALFFGAGAATTISPYWLAIFFLLGGIMLLYVLRRT